MTAPIAAQALEKHYGPKVKALQGVTFALKPGERACLLGPNGAGKTTLIRLLTGAFAPSAGHVTVLGKRSTDRDFLHVRRRVGLVPQAPGMYRDIRVGEYLQLVAELYGRGDVQARIARAGLGAWENRLMGELSGGYQRRLVIAAALLPEPELLLLDEPTVGLDPVATREVHDMLRDAMVGKTTLLCTHNLAEAEALCDTVLILREGRVLVHESIAALRARVRPRLALRAQQGPEALAQGLRNRGLEVTVGPHGVEFPVDNPEAQAPELLRTLLADGLDVFACQPIVPSLEALFLQQVKGEA